MSTVNVEYLSFGAGPPSVALMVLNAWGEVTPPAKLIVFADTGWEKKETYRLLPVYENWAAEMGLELVTTQSDLGSLKDRVKMGNQGKMGIPIPAFTESGMGRRFCTDNWKIRPIEKYLGDRFGKKGKVVAQIGMTREEAHRMRDPKRKLTTNRYPLIEKNLSRSDCVEIIKMAGLPVPPWSACAGCPFHSNARWAQMASRFPEDFLEAAEIDHGLRQGEGVQKWLHSSRKPLGQLYSTDQLSFPLGEDGGLVEQEGCSDANCFT